MNTEKLNNFITVLKNVAYEAGKIAIQSQNNVKNIGKNVEHLPQDKNYTRQRAAAKTVIDDQIQEIILNMVVKVIDPNIVFLDAEEDTISKNLFSKKPTKYTLVVDPIDGTLEYTLGHDSYSIAIGLIEDAEMIAALVYFPRRNEFYFMKDNNVFLETNKKVEKINPPLEISEKKIYVNSRISNSILEDLKEEGFIITSDEKINWLDGLLMCMRGEFKTCIFHTPQIRDILLGAMISKLPKGYSNDWKGNKIIWPNGGGRVKKIIFGYGEVPERILFSLKDK